MIPTSRLFKSLSALLFSTASGMALAASGWTDAGQVTLVNQQPAVGAAPNQVLVEVSVTVNPSDATACSTRNGFYFLVTDDRRKRLFASLLAAQASSRPVKIYTSGNCNVWGYAEADGLAM